MHDSISGFEFHLQMQITIKEGNFNLRKWISNCAEIMGKINSFEEKSLTRKLFSLINFIKFWVFCGTLKLMNCSLI